MDKNEEKVIAERKEHGSSLVDGWTDIRRASNIGKADPSDAAHRYFLWQLRHFASEGQSVPAGDCGLEILKMTGRVINNVRLRRKEAIA